MLNPYEYYEGKLGVKVSFLIADRNLNEKSLRFINYNALYKRMVSTNQPEQQLRRASLNYDALIDYNTISREWKDSLTMAFGSPKTEIKKSWFAQHYEADRKAGDFYAGYRYGEDNRKLDLKLIETYIYNASVLNAVIKIRENRKNYIKALGAKNVNLWESLSNDVNAFREVEHNLPSTSRGLRLIYNKYVEQGYEGLISGRLSNQNAAKLKENKQFALIDELLARHTNLDFTVIADIYNVVCEETNWPKVTAQTIANRKKENNLVVYAGRKGTSALSNNILMQNKRKAPSASMLFWTLDGWDAELLYQKTESNKKGYSTTTYHNRLTMVVVLDPFNKYPVGYAIGTHETPELIKEALRNAYRHVYELFGAFYRPYQLQSDNYSIKKLKPLYEACSQHFTPAAVRNSKAKVVEPYFNQINKQYCKLFDNWSGHNVDSGSNKQPNAEYLNKIRNQFPDEFGCRQQLISIIESERVAKQEAFKQAFNNVSIEHKSELTIELYLRTLGEKSQYTNRLTGAGLQPTINGVTYSFDSFDRTFRQQSQFQDWAVMYDPNDLSKVLVSNAKSSGGKLIEDIGNYEFILEQKHIQPMALAERNEGDAMKLQAVKSYNKEIMQYITDERTNNALELEELFQNPALNDTLAKHLLVDSRGQHKDRKSEQRLEQKEKVLIEANTTKDDNENWHQKINEFNKQRANLNDYL